MHLQLLLYFGSGRKPSYNMHDQLREKLVCIEHSTCGGCLAAAEHCRWCADPYFSTARPRCDDDQSLVASGCSQEAIQRPDKPVWEVAENSSLQDVEPDRLQAVQIQPQRIKLSLKPRETKKINFSFRAARNYPLDLYYLMDLTWSMKDDKETLVSLRDDLPSMLKNLTDNFRLGFGSFAEKPIMPFISTDARRLANPCTVEEEACESTYSYKHHLSLTNEVSKFIEKVNSSSVTANLDNAEAQLDALVQAVTCGTAVGWSPHSRKIVILLSDGLMHTAGDGKLGGASLKNDETCHLDENGYYSESSKYDYPSVAQVYRLLDKHKVNVIFAVTQGVKGHYDSLHKLLNDYTYVAKLESDSSNILKLVKMGYEDFVSVVSFEDDLNSEFIKIKYFTDCGVKGGSLTEAKRCTGVEYGMTLNFEAHISLESCPEYKKSRQTITISESQLGQDALTLEVEVQCGCHCDAGDAKSDAALTCPSNSHLTCGVCECNKGWSGPQCDCSIEDEAASAALASQCRMPNTTHTHACSGAGECVCGVCECDPGFNGRYCQCKRCELSLENNQECGGVGRGVCVCGQCACAAGWSGAACDCTGNTDTCKPPGSDDVCSGHGDCVCGRCQCSALEGETVYSGVFCETCATCENPLCANAEPCVSCHLSNNCTDLCTIGNMNYTVSEKYNAESQSDDTSCIFRRAENGYECEYGYTYKAGVQSMIAMEIVIRSKECFQPTSAKIMFSSIVIMVCIIAGGIIIILAIKCAQIVSDKRAYAKFLQEAQESRKNMQEMNPLYISPISEFRLPDAYPREAY
ncbi:integrin beta-nu isoform X2 [Aricia agestis]|uniref:integrin beta-nu isoform X2 n=1 Tax=Aricia agestis TaxID=91739 RepID=UPI001C208C6A|nr:integrin beta-nu isoform X2 [Aricia agestis]